MKTTEKNTPEIWDDVWKKDYNVSKNRIILECVSKGILTKRILSILHKKYGSLKGLKSIEIGGGMGKMSAILAKEGVDVTILDYSKKAIEKGNKFFKDNCLKANFLYCNALNLRKKTLSKFDISMSFGTAEHFINEHRRKIIKAHFDVLKEGGTTFISVPNKKNFLYRVHKFLSQEFNRWIYGEEYPFSDKELIKISERYCKKSFIIGGYLFKSPFMIFKRIRKLIGDKKERHIKKEFGTPLDKFYSTGICLVAEK
jgi:2-polyprenyl-3-methyl-5-hydroxy-6-metoxy-1,4-benzoquinol methylase